MKNIFKNKTNIIENSVVLAVQEYGYVGIVNSSNACAKIFMNKNYMIKK